MDCLKVEGAFGAPLANGDLLLHGVETDIGRYKQIIGDKVGIARAMHARRSKWAIAVRVSNRMLELGRPGSMCTA